MLEPLSNLNDSIFLHVQINDQGIYAIDTRIQKGDSWKHYRYKTNDKNEVLLIFSQYFELKKTPDISSWKDITFEILNSYENQNNYPEDYDKANELCSMSSDDLIKEIASFIRIKAMEHSKIYGVESIYPTNSHMREFFQTKGIQDFLRLSGESAQKLLNFYNSAGKMYYEEEEKRNYIKIMSYVDKCVIWAKGKKKLTKAEIDMFLYENNIKIKKADLKNIFYLKVNEKL